jgi:hypothetical protein
MTEKNLGNNFGGMWYGEVVDVMDPDQSGRCRVRVYGRHDDKENVPDDKLPWAMPLQPVTSAAMGKIGQAPLGLLKGSKVMGMWADRDQQYPIIMGSFGKAGDPKEGGSVTDGVPEIDKDKGSIPTGATNQSPPVAKNPYSILNKDRVTINDINSGAKTVQSVSKAAGIINNKEVDSKLKEPVIPTIASAAKGSGEHILDLVKKVDPSGKSASIPSMVSNMSNVKNIINISSPLGQQNMMAGVVGGLVGNLASKFGLSSVAGMLSNALKVGAATGLLNGLDPSLVRGIKIGLATAVNASLANGGRAIPHVVPPTTRPTSTSRLPPETYIVTGPPDMYVQQYYTMDEDPYPGYIEWYHKPTNQKRYTLRNGQPHYTSPIDHVKGNATVAIASTLASSLLSGSMPSPSTVLGALSGGFAGMKAEGMTKVLGAGVSMQNITGMASKLLPGGLGGGIDGLMKGHLPTSVLGAGAGQAMAGFTQGQAMLAAKKSSLVDSIKPKDSELDGKLDDSMKGLSAADKASVMNGGLTTAEKAAVQQSQIDSTFGADRPVIRG